MITIGPNKEMAWYFLILGAALFSLGLYLFIYAPTEKWELFYIISLSGKSVGIALMLFLPFFLFILISTYTAKKRIVITQDSFQTIEGKTIKWHGIDRVVIHSINMIKMGVIIYKKNKKSIFVKWNRIDCGITRFAEILPKMISANQQG